MKNLKAVFITAGFLLVLLTAQAVAMFVNAQPITASTPFEQLAQGQGQQPTAAATGTAPPPGTILLTTFPNGTSKAIFANGTVIQILNGVGYLVLDSSVSAATAATASASVSNTVVNRIYQAIAIAIGISINNTFLQPPQQPPTNDTQGPDEQCLFDPSLPHCAADPEGGCPDGFFMNEDNQCVPSHTRCPDGYHSHEDDESGRCIPDSIPCQDGYIMNPGFPSCDIKEFACQESPELEECQVEEQPGIEPIPEPEPSPEPEPDGDGGNGNGNGDNDNDTGNDEDQDEDENNAGN
ncbi:MAG TPA: hypothetical protein VE504_07785 [Nitrososphaeraceae archaeon]|nr:hypothetical protein [Nitrososphaeraceae archaeon]